MRYAREPDFAAWSDRLEIFGLDLRHTPSVEAFCHLLLTRDDGHQRLDFIVNNACQTVRRPPEFYRHMMASEVAAFDSLDERQRRILGSYEALRDPQRLPASRRRARRSSALEYGLSGAGGRRRPHACRGAVAGRAPPGRARARARTLSRRAAGSGPAAGRPARPQLLAAGARRSLHGRAARGAAGERGGAVRAERAPEAADAAHRRTATSTSSTSRRSKGSSTAT